MALRSIKKSTPQAIILTSSGDVRSGGRPSPKDPLHISVLTIALFVALLGSLGLVWYSYATYVQKFAAQVVIRKEAETKLVIARVARLLDVPDDEAPHVARVSDPSVLKSNEFFANAVLGDRILVYCGAQKTILYSPSRDKIIEVFPQALPGVCQ